MIRRQGWMPSSGFVDISEFRIIYHANLISAVGSLASARQPFPLSSSRDETGRFRAPQ